VDLEVLYNEAYPRLYRYCHRLTGEADVAEDVAQEAFVRLWYRQVSGEPKALTSWLFKVATHLVRDRVRATENRRRLLEVHPVKPGGSEAPDARAERLEAQERVRTVLDTMTTRDRVMLLMREEGFSYREIAEAADVAPASVGTLLARALKRFASGYHGTWDESAVTEEVDDI
jgi:RNA polymerase sigma-70 factor (ECF subfamily)